MEEPQLRCLLCDLVLAEEATPADKKEKCRSCGRDMLRGQRVDEPVQLEQLQPPSLPADDVPVAKVVPARRTSTTASVPYARTSRPPTRSAPSAHPIQSQERQRILPTPASRPQVFKALGVLGCVVILGILCVSAIAFTVVFGLQKARKNSTQLPSSTTTALINRSQIFHARS